MTRRRPLVAGNWKMNGTRASLGELDVLAEGLKTLNPSPSCEVMICPPATLLMAMSEKARAGDAGILVAGQDCHSEPAGAHTGDISAEMLADAGAVAVIVGHSERRQDHGESDEAICAKAKAAHRAGLTAIVCIGETQTQREAGETLEVLARQLSFSLPDAASGEDTIIAYEPVWAIGSGLTPNPADIAGAHAHIRASLGQRLGEAVADGVRVLYGGSVNPDNARELMAVDGVDGALVGGASLDARDFLGIVKAYQV